MQSKESSSLQHELDEARRCTDALFRLVHPDSIHDRPIPERHRIIFYLGHLEAFDWNLIGRREFGMLSFSEDLDRLFAFGIDPDSSDLPNDQPEDWPNVERVLDYNERVREALDRLVPKSSIQALNMAIEHRLMHAETFAYMLHNMPYDRKVCMRTNPIVGSASVNTQMVELPGGPALLGSADEDQFAWDNELPAHVVDVLPFAISKYKVSNGEFLEFVDSGAPPPRSWRLREGQWMFKGMFAEIPLPLDWPATVTHEQANAFARWKGMRLPSEPEFHLAAFGKDRASSFDPAQDNYDCRSWDPIPLRGAPANAFGVVQAVGNGWEWTSTVFQPFPGFTPFPSYPGYSADFFDGQHFVLKGASQRTAARLTRSSFRNWFRASYPYAYTTFRLARSLEN